MKCQNCNKEIDNDSKFCEFCRAKVEDVTKTRAEVPAKLDKDLENLRSKAWYRFLKMLYIAGFCFSIFYLFNSLSDDSLKVFEDNNIIINCENYRNLREAPNHDVWYYSFRNNITSINENNKIVESCDGKNSFINLNVDIILGYLISPLIMVVLFEFLRQVGYYIFLGKLHHSWLTAKLVRIWK